MTRLRARVRIIVTVEFDDDGTSSLPHQAEQAALFELGLPSEPDSKVGDARIDAVSVVTEGGGPDVRKISE